MSRRIVLRRKAQREFEDSIDWYNRERKGLGDDFQAEIERCLDRIANFPEQFRKVRGEVRRAVVRPRFPFVIHFRVEQETILVLAIFHTSRDPARLRHRR